MPPNKLCRTSTPFLRSQPKSQVYGHPYFRSLQVNISKTHDHPKSSSPLNPAIPWKIPNLPPLRPGRHPQRSINKKKPNISKHIHRWKSSISTPSRTPSNKKGTLTGKTAVITGGSRGIGLAIAQRFALEGASCILVGRDELTLQKALETLFRPGYFEVEREDGRVLQEHSFISGDISHRDFWVDLVKSAEVRLISSTISLTEFQTRKVNWLLFLLFYLYGSKLYLKHSIEFKRTYQLSLSRVLKIPIQ